MPELCMILSHPTMMTVAFPADIALSKLANAGADPIFPLQQQM